MSLFHVALGRRSIAGPSGPLSQTAPWLYDMLAGGPSSTGVRVSRETALTHAGNWRAMSLITRTVAKVDTVLYVKDETGRKAAVTDPRYRMLLRKWNREMTAFVAKQLVCANMLQDGTGYCYVVRNGAGVAEELIPLAAGTCHAVRVNGVLWYSVTMPGALGTRPVPFDDVCAFKDLSADGVSGHNRISKMRETLGSGLAAREYTARFYSTGGGKKILLETPNPMDEKAVKEFLVTWNANTTGLEAIHRTAILTNGMKANVVGSTARDAQVIEQRVFDNREVALFYDLPPSKLGDPNSKSYASLEQDNQTTLDEAYDPIFVNWEQELEDKILTEDEKRRNAMSIEFSREDLVRADLAARAEADSKSLAGQAWKTIEEVRVRNGLNAKPSVGKLQQPINMQPPKPDDDPESAPAPTPKPAPVDEDEQQEAEAGAEAEAQRAAVARAVEACERDARRRMLRRLCTHVRREARSADRLAVCLGGLEAEHRRSVEEALAAPVDALAALTRAEPRPMLAEIVRGLFVQVRRTVEAAVHRATPKTLAAEIDAALTTLEAADGDRA